MISHFSVWRILVAYLIMGLVIGVLDYVWLGILMKDFFQGHMQEILREEFVWGAALAFYFLFLIGLLIFALIPAWEKNSWKRAFLLGGLFGFFCYATYDFTNWATLVGWPSEIVFVDISWGFFMGAMGALSGFFAGKFLSK